MSLEGGSFSQEISNHSARSPRNKRYIRVRGGKMTTEDAKAYLSKREVPQLFECLMTGLMYHRPKDHISYLRDCLDKIRSKGLDHVRWNLFIEQRRKTPLPPISPENGSRPHSARSSYSKGGSQSQIEMGIQPPLPPIRKATETTQNASDAVIRIGNLVIPNVPFVFFMGGPGSGKGTQCKRLIERYPTWVHLSMGDLLREQISEQGTTDAKWGMISDLLTKGDMAPEDVTMDLIVENLKKYPNAGGYIIEGYPRTLDQLKEYQNKISKIDLVFLIDCEEYFLQSRLLARGKTEGRIDDNLGAVGAKIEFFKEYTLPVVKELDDDGKLVLVDGDRDAEEIFYELTLAFDSIFFNAGDGKPILPTAPKPDAHAPRPPSGKKSPRSGRGSRGGSAGSRASSAGSQASFPPITHIDDIRVTWDDKGRMPDLPQCPIILIMGGPGSGKLTQCRRLVERYDGVVHLSMGDILKSEIVARGTGEDKWNLVGSLVQKGEMAPEDVTIELLLSTIRQHGDAKAILLEGYPRNGAQIEEFNKHVGGVSLAILLDCEEYYLKQRLLQRLKEEDRIDDNINAISKRMVHFKENTLPVIKHYDGEDKLVIVYADRDIDEIFYDLATLFDHMFFGTPGESGSGEDIIVEETIVEEAAQSVANDSGGTYREVLSLDEGGQIEETVITTEVAQETGGHGNPEYVALLEQQGGQEEMTVPPISPPQQEQGESSPPRPATNASQKSGGQQEVVDVEIRHSSKKGSKPGSPGSHHESPKPQSREGSKKGSKPGSPGSQHDSPKPHSREGSKKGSKPSSPDGTHSPKPHSRKGSASSKSSSSSSNKSSKKGSSHGSGGKD